MSCIDTDINESSTHFTAKKIYSIDDIDKNTLKDRNGLSYKAFKNSLKPRRGILWFEFFAGYIVLAITAGIMFATNKLTYLQPFSIIIASFLFGYTHAYIQLFFHEAAHGNLAKNRKLNDLLGNYLIGIFIGQDIKVYRLIHFGHHRWHGTIEDTERTYFSPLNLGFILKSVLGIAILNVLIYRKNIDTATANIKRFINSQLLLGVSLHIGILSTALWLGQWPFCLAWIFGMSIVFPFFIAVRQVLEHRSIYASSKINYNKIPHGPVHRLFGDSFLARTLGGAGFNRHLLHHWEPQLSYTQLRALEKFLLQTEAADIIRNHQTTYTAIFMQLMRAQ